MFAGGTQRARLARPAAPARPRAKKVAGPAPERAEHLDATTRARLLEEIGLLVRRRPSSEAHVAAVLRTLAPWSAVLRAELQRAAEVLLRRGSLGRDLWAAAIRTLAETAHPDAASLLVGALAHEEGGGAATLTAACFSDAPELAAPLAKLASGSKPFVAFGAEIARVLRGDSVGAHLLHLAPIIKEAHRVALATGVVVPLVQALSTRPRFGAPRGEGLGPGFEVLRSAERHLGRWLAFAEAVVLAGDSRPLDHARERSRSGAASSRVAWGLLAWALADAAARALGSAPPPPPDLRPTMELAARLSDRPSADRDLAFLFRLAAHKVPTTRPMLESLVRGSLNDPASVRAASYLVRDFARVDLLGPLRDCAASAPREELRGLALGALWDAGDLDVAAARAQDLLSAKHLGTMAWSARVRMASAGALLGPVVDEPTVRRLQWGSVD